jgi:hypothetical protein
MADAVDVRVLDRATIRAVISARRHPERGVDAGHTQSSCGQQLVG